ncbi:MAG: hypothetical protein K2K47_03770 [Duncaniella sp.]|nr:hypothetical protein [Duncaniella sp.]
MAEDNYYHNDSREISSLCRRVEAVANMEVRTAGQFDILSNILNIRTGILLSPTTLKRLWGYLDEPVKPRRSTLDVLARFCGWRDFDDFTAGNFPEIESGNIGSAVIRAGKNISRGERVRLFWPPSRMCLVEYTGDFDWKVIESEGTRLNPGDRFNCALIVSGEPLYLDNLIKDNNRVGLYVCGSKSGITFKMEE